MGPNRLKVEGGIPEGMALPMPKIPELHPWGPSEFCGIYRGVVEGLSSLALGEDSKSSSSEPQ